ncbi:MAG: C40 family peptidase [Coriobacteriia bacterium]
MVWYDTLELVTGLGVLLKYSPTQPEVNVRAMRHSRIIVLVCSILVIGSLLATPAFAEPTNAEIEAARAEADAARAELDRMNAELEIQVEEYNAITEELEATRERIRETRDDLELAERELSAAQVQLAERAANIYKDGGTGFLEVLLGTTSFEDLVTRLDLLTRINRSDALVVADVKEAKAQVEALKRSLEAREAEQVALRSEAEARAQAIERKIADQAAYVGRLDSEIKQLIAEEEERQRKLAEERARQAAAAAAQYASNRTPTDPGSLGAGHPEAVQIALQYLGVPYQWGGSSPSGFDCSGLCQYVYRQIGIDLPRTSRSQFKAGQHIPPGRLDLLVPGDLVFFGYDGDPSRVHHVGIYVGDGNYVHAPQTGDVVKVSSLTERIASRGDYVGASRF